VSKRLLEHNKSALAEQGRYLKGRSETWVKRILGTMRTFKREKEEVRSRLSLLTQTATRGRPETPLVGVEGKKILRSRRERTLWKMGRC